MTKYLKEIINNSVPYELGKPLHSIYIISTGKLYQGFWGKNGYNGIIIIGSSGKDNRFYHVNGEYEVDVIRLGENVEIDGMEIPHNVNCIHIWFKNQVCFTDVLSTMIVEQYKKQEEK